MSFSLDATKLIKAYAAMKGIPIEKVVRNAARDYVFAAQRATPTARKKGLEWISFEQPSTGRTVWIKADEVFTTGGAKARRAAATSLKARLDGNQLRFHYINKGWSKSTWLGALPMLGLEPKHPSRYLTDAPSMLEMQKATDGQSASLVITDYIHFKAYPGKLSEINEAGMRRASWKLVKDYMKMLRDAWKGERVNAEQ